MEPPPPPREAVWSGGLPGGLCSALSPINSLHPGLILLFLLRVVSLKQCEQPGRKSLTTLLGNSAPGHLFGGREGIYNDPFQKKAIIDLSSPHHKTYLFSFLGCSIGQLSGKAVEKDNSLLPKQNSLPPTPYSGK